MAWIVVSIPLGVATLILVGFDQSGGQATLPARYLDCMLPLFAILVAYGAVALLGSRLGSLALLTVMVVGTFLEVPSDRAWVRATYTADTIGRSIPVVEQSYADGLAPLSSVQASASCPVSTVALNVIGSPPKAISVNGQQSPVQATDGVWTEYRLIRPVRGHLNIEFPGPVPLATARDLGSLSSDSGGVTVSASGLPAIRLYCRVAQPEVDRFLQLYPTNHPSISLGTLLAWPELEAWVGVALTLTVALGVAWSSNDHAGAHHRRRRTRPTD